ncbi:glycosyltransferase [Nocardioides sp. TF02-7]|uniref:glycosyltransferase n=1 Tax=Nocardioides sp. TF02-7 TaxID=2917724 RepID=UPI001F06090A|nr:glycosyltransferase [Nocardioides sp. TF02-7]UMG93063.1 hypothetical protein MF408_01585 [Nocardioides sp. TF02-7]
MTAPDPSQSPRLRSAVARRVPGLRELVRLREENARLVRERNRLRKELRKARRRHKAARGRVRTLKKDAAAARRAERRRTEALGAVRVELASTRRELRRLREATGWLDAEQQTEGHRAGHGVRARAAAAALVESISRGADPAVALVAYARALAELPQYPFRYRLPALAAALEPTGAFGPGAAAALAVHGLHADHPELARHHLQRCGDDALRLIPVEYARIRLAADPTAAADVLDHLRRLAAPAADEWLDILAAISAAGDLATLAEATELAASRVDGWDADQERVLRRFQEWAGRAAGAPAVPAADVTLGVMGYRRPDARTGSKNVGDFVQTIAALSHVVRRTGVRLTGEPELVAAAERLRSRVRPELRVDGDDATVALVEVGRDDSPLDPVPDRTWYIAFGWHIHPNVLGGHGLPYHPNLRPVFVAFHCNRRDMLDEAAVEYLKRYAPIGCRDWYTVDLLTHLGVPAFFTGCLTTTVDAYFEPDVDRTALPAGYVDSPAPTGQPMRQADPEVRHASLGANLERALDLLDHYHQGFGSLTTSRLHCYLPATSIGVPTEFRPRRPFDVRFEGLTDERADLAAMRARLRDRLLEPVVTAMLRGAPEADVYGLWRSITEPMVAADAAAREAAYPWPESGIDVPKAVAAITEAAWRRPVAHAAGERVVDLCFGLDRNYLPQLRTVVHRLLERTDRPLRVWALVRGLDDADYERFAEAFPEVDVTFLPCDAVDFGEISVGSGRITVSTMDRLLLPELLDDVDRVLYLDLDLLPRADVGELFDTPLDGAPLAARESPSTDAMGGVVSFAEVAHHHLGDSREAWRLLNLVHRHSDVGDAGFNAGVLLMDLRRMRSDEFLVRYAGFAEQFGLNDQYVLNLYAGARFAPLDRRWNFWPTRDVPRRGPSDRPLGRPAEAVGRRRRRPPGRVAGRRARGAGAHRARRHLVA